MGLLLTVAYDERMAGRTVCRCSSFLWLSPSVRLLLAESDLQLLNAPPTETPQPEPRQLQLRAGLHALAIAAATRPAHGLLRLPCLAPAVVGPRRSRNRPPSATFLCPSACPRPSLPARAYDAVFERYRRIADGGWLTLLMADSGGWLTLADG